MSITTTQNQPFPDTTLGQWRYTQDPAMLTKKLHFPFPSSSFQGAVRWCFTGIAAVIIVAFRKAFSD